MPRQRQLHVRVDGPSLADLRAITRCPDSAIVRSGLALLSEMIRDGQVDALRVRVAENVTLPGPKPKAA